MSGSPINPDRCPADPDASAEAYLRGSMTPEAEYAYENHYITCAACAELLEALDQLQNALRAATQSYEIKTSARSA